jgi:hypothetical protein
MKSWLRKYHAPLIYIVLAGAAVASYQGMVDLLAVQTVWVNVAAGGRLAVSVFAALFIWVWVIERLSNKRKWSQRKSWALQLAGVAVLVLVISAN